MDQNLRTLLHQDSPHLPHSAMASNNGAAPQPARKTAIVTGGVSGIGLAMSKHFASQGYNVAVFDVAATEDAAAALKAIIAESGAPQERLVFTRCDVSSWQEQDEGFRAVFKAFGRIDVVCANAGISERGAGALTVIEEDEPRKPDLKIMNVNLSGVIFCKLFSSFLRVVAHMSYVR